MSRLTERAKKAMLNREIILTYDGEYWFAYDPADTFTVLAKHSVLDVLFDSVNIYYIAKEWAIKDAKGHGK